MLSFVNGAIVEWMDVEMFDRIGEPLVLVYAYECKWLKHSNDYFFPYPT